MGAITGEGDPKAAESRRVGSQVELKRLPEGFELRETPEKLYLYHNPCDNLIGTFHALNQVAVEAIVSSAEEHRCTANLSIQ